MISLLVQYQEAILKAFGETLVMLSISLTLSFIFGLILGISLVLSAQDGEKPNRLLYSVCNISVNVVRSFPYILFVVFMMPFTRWLLGFTLGTIPASVPLSIIGIATFARFVEQSLLDLPNSLKDTAKTMNASVFQTLWHFYLVEARPSLILGFTSTFVSLLSYSTVMGIVSGGGLGDFALIYGYHNHQYDLMAVVVIIIILIVQCIQWIGHAFARKLDKS